MIAGLIQSRIDSTRLPNKAILNLGKIKIIEHCINGVKRSKYFTPILVTSDRSIDDPLEEVANYNNILCFRGNYANVAKRIKSCINKYNITCFARINGDSPFLSSELLDNGYETLIKGKFDIVSNIINRTFPYGISLEIFNSNIYLDYYEKIYPNKLFREHHTAYFYKNISSFKYYSLTNKEDLSKIRLTIDTKEDYTKALNLLQNNPEIFTADLQTVLKILKQTKL